ncbi:MAG: peptide-methionine (S)-S-oxide reductase MsrA [Synechococcus sp. SB0666_bin_14]|nr:peptide-methionine (S)-S-oxide reductase MsrA [Synechococcus sp. SB0666_bin_14]
MFGRFGGNRTASVSAGAALPGRTTPIPTARRHHVLGTPLLGPVPPGFADCSFGCGCFWGVEKAFWRLPGVHVTSVGYQGGSTPNPTYEEVCSGATGHAEVVRVVWDPTVTGFADVLKLFWECHDPTQGMGQGNDRGTQYRSGIYTVLEEQAPMAEASRTAYQHLLSAAGRGKITTEITSGQPFFPAEAYHQQYLAKPGSRPYCSAMPTGQVLGDFPGADYKLPPQAWSHYDWSVSHCVLRGDNTPIAL